MRVVECVIALVRLRRRRLVGHVTVLLSRRRAAVAMSRCGRPTGLAWERLPCWARSALMPWLAVVCLAVRRPVPWQLRGRARASRWRTLSVGLVV